MHRRAQVAIQLIEQPLNPFSPARPLKPLLVPLQPFLIFGASFIGRFCLGQIILHGGSPTAARRSLRCSGSSVIHRRYCPSGHGSD